MVTKPDVVFAAVVGIRDREKGIKASHLLETKSGFGFVFDEISD